MGWTFGDFALSNISGSLLVKKYTVRPIALCAANMRKRGNNVCYIRWNRVAHGWRGIGRIFLCAY
jgi:hypothetical protein